MTYVIDYKKKLVKKFNNKELTEFLNYSYSKKNRFIFVNNKKDAKQVIKYAMRLIN